MTAAAAYSAGAVARRLGVAVTTLRTWHQRYGMGPSLHEPGHHRRYTEQDIERLETMQRLIVQGVAPHEAARWALRSAAAPAAVSGSFVADTAASSRGLYRAALRLDAPAVRQRVAAAVHELGVVAAWDQVLRPVLAAIGDRHAATGALVEVEHLVSGCVSAVFGAIPRPDPTVPSRILLACADEEQHSLPIEALGAALATAGVGTRMLGARVPPTALATAVRRTGPAAVLVWSQLRTTGDPAQLSPVLDAAWRPLIVAAAGPGWDVAALPAGVSAPSTLTEALALLTSVVN
ncbi:MerR family transcriptional regulator [Dactylosporangium sp. NPDC050588]|uniref:MerR family transcriptional regulator n=1 Tax=Dactylosporangium sp. NPDC050588 TaxID=3157211 RepID=UPI0033E17FFF